MGRYYKLADLSMLARSHTIKIIILLLMNSIEELCSKQIIKLFGTTVKNVLYQYLLKVILIMYKKIGLQITIIMIQLLCSGNFHFILEKYYLKLIINWSIFIIIYKLKEQLTRLLSILNFILDLNLLR